MQTERTSSDVPGAEATLPDDADADAQEDAQGNALSEAVTPRPWWQPPRSVALVVVVAFLLRLLWVLMAGHEPTAFGDAAAYMRFARGIAAGDGYNGLGIFLTQSHVPTAYHPIGYPGLLGIVFWIGNTLGVHEDAHLADLLNLVLGTATVGLVYGIAARVFDRAVGLVAAWTVALWPNLIFYTTSVLSETAFAFTVVLAVWIAVATPWPEGLTVRRAVLYGAVIGASILIRPFSALLLVLAVIVLLVARVPWGRVWRFAGAAALATLVVVAPWTIRNAIEMGGFVPVATNVGDLLCIDNSPGANGAARLARGCPDSPSLKFSARAEVESNSRNTNYALKWAVTHPLAELWLLPQRLYYGYESDHDGLDEAMLQRPHDHPVTQKHAVQLALIADVYFFVVLAFAVFGLAWFFSRSRPRRLFVGLAALGLAATPLYTYGLPRFHVPALPLIAILSAPALVALARAVRVARSEPAQSAPAGAEPVPPPSA